MSINSKQKENFKNSIISCINICFVVWLETVKFDIGYFSERCMFDFLTLNRYIYIISCNRIRDFEITFVKKKSYMKVPTTKEYTKMASF